MGCLKDAYDLYRKDSSYANPENDNKSPTKAASYCEKNSRDRYPARCLKDMYDMYHTASPHTKDSADKAASYCETDAGASEFSGIIVSQASAFVILLMFLGSCIMGIIVYVHRSRRSLSTSLVPLLA